MGFGGKTRKPDWKFLSPDLGCGRSGDRFPRFRLPSEFAGLSYRMTAEIQH